MKFSAHAYQARAVRHLLDNPGAALWLDMGLGKTAVTLTAIGTLVDSLEIRRVLIVGPLRVVRSTWPAEISKWEHTRWLRHSLILGNPKQRRAAIASTAPVHLINYENLAWLVEELGDDWPYDMVVLDESSKMKSHATKRFRALRKVRARIKRVVELTGTPAPQGSHDLWSQAYLLDAGQRLGKTVSAFRARWFEKDYWGHTWLLRQGAAKQIHGRLADVCLSMAASDYLELPDYIENVIPIDIGPAMADYEELEREMYLELAGLEVEAVNAAVLTSKCHQYAQGQLYGEEGTWEAVHSAKLEALEDVIEEAAGQPVLVAYTFKSDLERLQQRFGGARVLDNDPATVEAWNCGEIPLLLAHPASAGHGLNLQRGGHILAWYGLNWSLELDQQMNARLHRQGQEHPVMVHRLVASGTVDEAILERLREKCTAQEALLKRMQKSVAEGV